ncbi:oxaloacetate decarboxylase gamma subunit [Sinobacterium caligoides]|uniref:Probable oxaloacetate decarboxylase gamma chain n=1 Tax=Sinobacterium caligoides TaxID=933926 RepID=A0A3N2DNG8_9GAMM|nr:OadG family protein [Sinobacterium caligoides]ROS01353.1 oxaloacetate decarboxylase gamma subunit [Sinobacterium caligoides]
MQESILQQGADLMLYGMGTVFVFLTLLVIVTTLMSSIIQRVAPERPALPVKGMPQPNNKANGQVDPQLTAVITAAIHQYRNKHGK